MTSKNRRSALRTLATALVAAPAAALLPVATASFAASEWCDVDPPVLITTPKGRLVTVYALIGAQGLTAALLTDLSRISYTVAPADNGMATQVTMNVTVNRLLLVSPSGTPTRVTVSSGLWGSGAFYGSATGTVGNAMTVSFIVPVA